MYMESPISNAHVLIIGITNDVLGAFINRVTNEGAHVELIRSGLDGLSQIRNHSFDLVVLDSAAPELSAVEMLEILTSENNRLDNVIVYQRSDAIGKHSGVLSTDVTTVVLDSADAATTLHQQAVAHIRTHAQGSNTQHDHVAQKTVCVVEDSPFIRDLLAPKLHTEGYGTCFVQDGSTAIEEIRRVHPDVVLLDLELPHVHGLAILRELKQDQTLQTIPVIVFTNDTRKDIESKAMEQGAAAFYFKAETMPNVLIAQIETILSK